MFRSTSCSRGWLRLLVQGIFGVIIVSSFISIQLMVLKSSNVHQPRPRRRCTVQNCRVICNDAPFFGEFEDHILHAIRDTKTHCGRVILTLNRPMFDNSSLPGHWLSAVRTNVTELEIVSGNLQHISPHSFMSQFGGNLVVLVLEKVIISTLAADTFLGLSNLRQLYINDCVLMNIMPNALQAIDDTLEILRIKTGDHWDPVHITSSTDFRQLRIVDLSMNIFQDVLGHNSFTKLQHTTVLNLNWCKITAIGAGAFEYLQNIEILHLSYNYLVSLPPNIFNKIIPLEPRISLHENSWKCSCSNHNLRILTKMDILIVDPICQYPDSYSGLTFSEFENYCYNESITQYIDQNVYIFTETVSVTGNEQCKINSSADKFAVDLRSPLPEYKCKSNKIDRTKLKSNIDGLSMDNNWLIPAFSIDTNRFSMVSLVFSGPYEYGLMWYKSSCPNEVYCINHLPKGLKVFNIDASIQYTFCQASFNSEGITSNKCVIYDLGSLRTSVNFYKSILLFVCIAIVSLLLGALCVYALIHRNPILLKGNKRVVFVKHKTVDALILPPKIPLRRNLTNDLNTAAGNNSSIFVISTSRKKSTSENCMRTNSIVTNTSTHPSYISALQPTEDQLAEWRIRRHLEVKYTYNTSEADLSNKSSIYSSDSLPYFSFDNTENFYDTIKL